MNNAILHMSHVEKSYQSGSDVIKVLKDVNLTVHSGESIAIMGTSGCGKSTLLNLIGGLDKLDGGIINSCGYPVNTLDEKNLSTYRSEVIGFVFQFHYLLKDFTAIENVMLPMVMQGARHKQAHEAAAEALEQVGLGNRAKHYPSQLSGGERQRAALARALINKPKLILADEPTGNLDEENKEKIAELIFSLLIESGKALLLVTHAKNLADRASKSYLLKEGLLQKI